MQFEWETLVKKFKIDYKRHPSETMLYFLNTNRCIYGDVRRVRSLLDGRKPVRGAEIFAMTSDCSQVMYHAKGQWSPYISAKNIRWTKNPNVGRKSVSEMELLSTKDGDIAG